MSCPKCKTRSGLVKHEIVLDSGIIHCLRCVICGYWSQPHPSYNLGHKLRDVNRLSGASTTPRLSNCQ